MSSNRQAAERGISKKVGKKTIKASFPKGCTRGVLFGQGKPSKI